MHSIIAYRGLRKINRKKKDDLDEFVELDEEGNPIPEKWRGQCFSVNMPRLAEGLDIDARYDFGEFSVVVPVAPWGHHQNPNDWREELALMAGYGMDLASAKANVIQAAQGPFWDLIRFDASAEEMIGPVVAQKLAMDFAVWDDRAKAFGARQEHPYFYETYKKFWTVMDVAQHGGAVRFLLRWG